MRNQLLLSMIASIQFFEPSSRSNRAIWTLYRFSSIKVALGQYSISRYIVKYGTRRRCQSQSIDFYRLRERSSGLIFFLYMDSFQLCPLGALLFKALITLPHPSSPSSALLRSSLASSDLTSFHHSIHSTHLSHRDSFKPDTDLKTNPPSYHAYG